MLRVRARVKPLLTTLLFAAVSATLGCSSRPLTGSEQVGEPTSGIPSGAPATTTATWVAYPAGPYGTTVGATIENLSFLGWKRPDAAAYDADKFETVRLSDFYDP